MCCIATLKATSEFKKKNIKNKVVTVYKTVEQRSYYCDNLKTRLGLGGVYYDYEYKPGIVDSTSISSLIKQNCEIGHGIHVWVDKKSAEKHRRGRGSRFKIVELVAFMEDLIGVGGFDCNGNNNAVFKKVYLTNEEYNKALKVRK